MIRECKQSADSVVNNTRTQFVTLTYSGNTDAVFECDFIPKEENIATLIYFIRCEKVMLDSDLAVLYGIEARVLNQAVKRNINRFPPDFMFQLNEKEFEILKRQFLSSIKHTSNSSQFVMSSRKHRGTKYLPLAFTEQGVAMLSGILKSKTAVNVNISIMRTFVQVRKLLHGNKALSQKIKELEKLLGEKLSEHDKKFQMIFEAIKQLIHQKNEPRMPIGFKIKRSK